MHHNPGSPYSNVEKKKFHYALLLTGEKIESEEDALAVMETIHSKGVGTVILSSTELGSDTHLVGLASQDKEGRKTVVKVGNDCHACVLYIFPCRFSFPSFLQLLWGLGICSQLLVQLGWQGLEET